MAEKQGFFTKIKAKAKNYWEERKGDIIAVAIIISGIVTIGGVAYSCGRDDQRRKMLNQMHKFADDYGTSAGDPDYAEIYAQAREDILRQMEEEKEDEENDLWSENYRASWDDLCECAAHLDLQPGEAYYLEEAATGRSEGAIIGNTIVCHMVDGTEVYPPDCEAYIEADWDEEEEEDEDEDEDDEDENDISPIVLRLIDANDSDARKTVADLVKLYHENRIEFADAD